MAKIASSPLLQSKISTPPLRPDWIRRPRLIDKLNQGLKGKVSLISAPPGFGKTTLLSEWAHQRKDSVAWLSLDKGDNDPVSFLTYLIASLQTVEKIFGLAAQKLLHSPQLLSYEPIAIALINSLTASPKSFSLVLDDYHLIQFKPIHDLLDFLIDHLPLKMHLLLSTRSDPPLSLSRLRSQNLLNEIRATDLSFDSNETTSYFREKMRLDLSIEDMALLESRTEGWITGLQLAALSLKDRNKVSDFVTNFAGDNRYIVDYLMDEALNRQPEYIQNFLLQTCILDPLSGPLCDAVTQQKNSQQMLVKMEKANLFIFSTDDGRNWFRYHRLFADSLCRRLRTMHAEFIPELHRRACDWYSHNGMEYQAVDHALAAKDFEQASFLIEAMAEAVWDRGQQFKLVQWFECLSKRIISLRPQLCIFYARSLIMSGKQREAEKYLSSAEEILESPTEEMIEILPDGTSFQHYFNRKELLSKVFAVRAMMAMYRGDQQQVIEHSQRALESLPADNLIWRGVVITMLGMAHGWAGDGDMAKAEKAFTEALTISEKAENVPFYLFAGLALAGIQTYQGLLNQSEKLCHRLLQVAEEAGLEQTGNAGSILSILGGILCERNDIEQGLPLIQKGLELAKLSRDVIALQGCRLNWIRVLILKKDFSKALRSLDAIEKDGKEFDLPPWMNHVVSAYRARIWLETGNSEEIARWVKDHGLSPDKLSSREEPEYVALSRILLSQNRYEEADYLLQKLILNAESGCRMTSVLEMRLVRSAGLYGQGNLEASLDELKKALSMGEPDGFINIFILGGPIIAELLKKIIEEEKTAASGINDSFSRAYVKKLIQTFEKAEVPKKIEGLREALSERELEVLQLISVGLTNQEIAEKLFISLNTVRTHTKNINSKLDAHSRTQATAKAKKLGLL